MTMLNKKNILLFIITISIIIAAICYVSTYKFSLHGNKIETVTIGSGKFRAEVVSSDKKMQKGLGGRNGLCDSCAMLFEFSQAGKHSFWMKDMRFPLDIIWIKDGEVLYIEKNVSENFSGTLSPRVDADSVLEIAAGSADKFSIEAGNKLFQ